MRSLNLLRLLLILLILLTTSCGSDDSQILIISSNYPANGADPNSGGTGSSIGFVSRNNGKINKNFTTSDSFVHINDQSDAACLGAVIGKNSILTNADCLSGNGDTNIANLDGKLIETKYIYFSQEQWGDNNNLAIIKTAENLNLPVISILAIQQTIALTNLNQSEFIQFIRENVPDVLLQ